MTALLLRRSSDPTNDIREEREHGVVVGDAGGAVDEAHLQELVDLLIQQHRCRHLVQKAVHRRHQIDLHQPGQHEDALGRLLQARRHVDHAGDGGEGEGDAEVAQHHANEVIIRRQTALLLILRVRGARLAWSLLWLFLAVARRQGIRTVDLLLTSRRDSIILVGGRNRIEIERRGVRTDTAIRFVHRRVEETSQFAQVVVSLSMKRDGIMNSVQQQRLAAGAQQRFALANHQFSRITVERHSEHEHKIEPLQRFICEEMGKRRHLNTVEGRLAFRRKLSLLVTAFRIPCIKQFCVIGLYNYIPKPHTLLLQQYLKRDIAFLISWIM